MPFLAHLPRPHDLVRFGPHNESHWVASRAGVAVGTPLVALTATGHQSWLVFAAFGAFTSLYGRGEGYRRRVHTQLAAAVTLVFAVLVGLGGALSARRRTRERPSPPFGVCRLVEDSAVRRHALRYGLAVLGAGSIATVAGIGHPSWAMVAAIVPLAVSDTRASSCGRATASVARQSGPWSRQRCSPCARPGGSSCWWSRCSSPWPSSSSCATTGSR